MAQENEFFLTDITSLFNPEKLFKFEMNSILNMIVLLLPVAYLYLKKTKKMDENTIIVSIALLFLTVLLFYALSQKQENTLLVQDDKEVFQLDTTQLSFAL
jgi:dipeptide/tripeptide permease